MKNLIAPENHFVVNPYPGLFVAFEGVDGAGSTTQTTTLTGLLRQRGLRVFPTKEPTDNVIGGLIRGALTGVFKLPPVALQLLFVTDRLHHLDRQIIPILQSGGIVISDRYVWSTVAFGSADIESPNWLLELNRFCILPDISFFLNVPVAICLERIRQNRFDLELFEEEEKLQRVWATYVWLHEQFKELTVIVDGQERHEVIAQRILNTVKSHPKFQKLQSKQSS